MSPSFLVVSTRIVVSLVTIVVSCAVLVVTLVSTEPLTRSLRSPQAAMANSAKPAVETVRRWRNIGTAPKTLADNTVYLRRMAAFARAGLRKMGRRVTTGRGPGGDRVVVIAYLWATGGGPIKLKPEEALAYTRLFFGVSPDWNEAWLMDSGFGPVW